MIKRKSVLVLSLVASVVFADVPVVDYTSDTRDTSHPRASTTSEKVEPVTVAPTSAATTAPSFSPGGLSIDKRLKQIEQQIDNINGQNLISKIDELQQRLQKLNGQCEDQAHQIEQLNIQLRNFYQDLNKRIEETNDTPGTSTKTRTKAPNTANVTNESVSDTLNETIASASMPATTPSAVTTGEIVEAVPSATKKNEEDGITPRTDKSFLKEQQMYQTAIDLLPDKKYGASSSKLRDYLKLYPKGVYVANAHYWLGEINFLQKNYDAAEEEFKIVINKYLKSKRVSDAAFKLALVHQQQGRDSQAKQELKQVVKRYSGTSAAQLAKLQLEGN